MLVLWEYSSGQPFYNRGRLKMNTLKKRKSNGNSRPDIEKVRIKTMPKVQNYFLKKIKTEVYGT